MQLLIYSGCLLLTILTLILSIYSLQSPTWIRFDTPSSSPFQYSSIYGLTQKCDKSNLNPEYECRRFPDLRRDCSGGGTREPSRIVEKKSVEAGLRQLNETMTHKRIAPLGGGLVFLDNNDDERDGFGFCEKWNTAAYTAQLSIVIGMINIFSTFLILIGNDYRQEHGWKICSGLISIHAIFQSLAWILIINVFNQDDRFYFGSRLSTSTYISIATTIIDLLFLTAIVAAGFTGIFTASSANAQDRRDDYERIH